MNTESGSTLSRRPSVILRSKITPQVAMADTELRPRLVDVLKDLESTALLLIQAPAGYGKTTLLQQFQQHLHKADQSVAWLTLYHTENDPMRAVAHIAAAFAVLDEEIDREMAPYFTATPPYPVEDVIASLINCLERFSSGVTLVLDDYHEITSSAVHSAVFFLLSNLPPSAHCIMASRARPPFEFSRLELRGKVITLGRNELRFTRDEIAHYLKTSGRLALSSESLDILSTQTEGWITAIKLAMMSMEGEAESLQIQQLITGSHYALVDYLTEAVLNRHDEETRQFLMQTAPLGRLTPDLCNAVTGKNNASEQLEKLARENLFINTLDNQGKWYRYHSLFTEFLCGLLSRDVSMARADIHKRASQWYEHNRMPEEAVEHAIASCDLTYAASMIDASVQELTRAGQITRLLGWLRQLPASTLNKSPKLLIHLGWCQSLSHQEKEANHTVELARQLCREQVDSMPDSAQSSAQENLAELEVLSQFTKRVSGNDWGDVKPLLVLKESLNPAWTFIRAATELELGYSYLHQGKLESAYAAFQDAHAFSQAVPNALTANLSFHMLASIRSIQGRFKECEELCSEGIKTAVDEQQRKPLPVAGRFHATLANIHYENNALDACRDHLEKAIALISLSSDPELLTETEILAARLLGLDHGAKAVIERLYEAERLVSRRGSHRLLNRIRAQQVWYLIEYQDLPAAEAILRQCEMPIDKSRPAPNFAANPANEFFYLALCRYWIASESYTQAGFWLRHLVKSAEWGQRLTSAVLFNGLLAVMLSKQGQSDAAARVIRNITITAAENSLARSIIGLGSDFVLLLDNYYQLRCSKDKVDAQDPVLSHTQSLIDIFKGSGHVVSSSQPPALNKPVKQAKTKEVNSLTPRELQVLEQVAKGLKNREVAEELLIAESSVQWHIKNLYAKLDVHNRTEASAKARELNLIR
ncbi:hypothetical protein HBA55_02465 [Pseudomaricurvus alkylphenolicus]|uniref:LuxR C-terminal-related transcriptional regulator n=1 Tax=Pseudomaricurvus alkylphenolicus TaxID=1306991 RepID=UPI001421DF7B|nr:LuxR C-terminal-related transcriptional regulator [Pseudomaricurvus alkylphenolicus]NIB38428.1 hypothetical protein [Pseudomaricurvus alkylphenolicus]